MNPVVMIGCPVQNREEVIKYYLEHIGNLDYPKKKIILLFFVNNTDDNTARIIKAFYRKHLEEYLDCLIFEDNKVYKGRQDGQHRMSRDFTLFSIVRNRFLDYAKNYQGWDYLFSVDSDVLVPPETLEKLLSRDKDIISALVYNGKAWDKRTKTYNYRIFRKDPITGREGYTFHTNIPDEIFPVDLTGACTLIRREVIEAGVKYKPFHRGEDLPFCISAKEKGFNIFLDPTIQTIHLLAGDRR